jgi:WD40 repeat protein
VYSVSWSPDGTRLVSAGWDAQIKIWNPANGALVCSLKGHNGVQSVAWSPDGTRIASCDLGGILLIHDATPGYAAEKLAGPETLSGKLQGRKAPSP